VQDFNISLERQVLCEVENSLCFVCVFHGFGLVKEYIHSLLPARRGRQKGMAPPKGG
jgi:hypothetical protein